MKFITKIRGFLGLGSKAEETAPQTEPIVVPDIDFSALDETTFFEILSDVLKKNKNDAVLFGAVAMSVYGYQRNTLDIDFMLPESDFENFKAILEKIGYEKILQTVQYAKFRHENEAFMDIDTVFIADTTADEVKKLAEEKDIGEGNSFLCASLETVLATKLHAIRHNNGCRGGKDVTDVRMLLKANEMDMSGEWFKHMCIKYGSQEIYDKFFTDERS